MNLPKLPRPNFRSWKLWLFVAVNVLGATGFALNMYSYWRREARDVKKAVATTSLAPDAFKDWEIESIEYHGLPELGYYQLVTRAGPLRSDVSVENKDVVTEDGVVEDLEYTPEDSTHEPVYTVIFRRSGSRIAISGTHAQYRELWEQAMPGETVTLTYCPVDVIAHLLTGYARNVLLKFSPKFTPGDAVPSDAGTDDGATEVIPP